MNTRSICTGTDTAARLPLQPRQEWSGVSYLADGRLLLPQVVQRLGGGGAADRRRRRLVPRLTPLPQRLDTLLRRGWDGTGRRSRVTRQLRGRVDVREGLRLGSAEVIGVGTFSKVGGPEGSD